MEHKVQYRNSDGVRRTAISDEASPDRFRVYTEVDMEEVLKGIQRDRDNHRTGSVNKLVARVPMTVMETSIHEQWDESDWKRWLNDPDNAAFRVWQGQV